MNFVCVHSGMQKQTGGAEKGQSQGVGRQHRSQASGIVRPTRVAAGRFAGRRTRAGHADCRTSKCTLCSIRSQSFTITPPRERVLCAAFYFRANSSGTRTFPADEVFERKIELFSSLRVLFGGPAFRLWYAKRVHARDVFTTELCRAGPVASSLARTLTVSKEMKREGLLFIYFTVTETRRFVTYRICYT